MGETALSLSLSLSHFFLYFSMEKKHDSNTPCHEARIIRERDRTEASVRGARARNTERDARTASLGLPSLA